MIACNAMLVSSLHFPRVESVQHEIVSINVSEERENGYRPPCPSYFCIWGRGNWVFVAQKNPQASSHTHNYVRMSFSVI